MLVIQNLSQRLKLHNSSKGAKYTKGRLENYLFKKFTSKSEAIKNEYKKKLFIKEENQK